VNGLGGERLSGDGARLLLETERLKLLERHERAMLANQDKIGETSTP